MIVTWPKNLILDFRFFYATRWSLKITQLNIYSEYLLFSLDFLRSLRMKSNPSCNILTFDPAVNRETGASSRRYHLEMWTGWIWCRCDAYKKQVDVKQLYNPVTQTFRVSWSQLVGVRGSENQLPAEGLGSQDSWLSSPAEWERSAAIVRGTWGQYIAVCSVSNSPLTHNPFATLPNKVWEVYFSKEVRSFVIIVDYVSAYICIRIVVSRLHNSLLYSKLHVNKAETVQNKQ